MAAQSEARYVDVKDEPRLERPIVQYGSARSVYAIIIGALLWVTLGGAALAHGTVRHDKPATISEFSFAFTHASDLTSNQVDSDFASVGSLDQRASASHGVRNYSRTSCPGGATCCNPGACCGPTCGGGVFLVSVCNPPFMLSAHAVQSRVQPGLAGMQREPGDRPPRV